MAIELPSDWSSLSGGSSSMGNPADLGPYRGMTQTRGTAYDKLADQQMDWAKKEYAKNRGVSDQVVGRALDTGSMFTDWAKADRGLWEQKGVPGLTKQMDYAMEYTTPERMAANRGAAMAGTNITFDAAADMAKRALMGYGVDPSAGRFAGLDAALAAKRATAAAGAGTKSDRTTEMMGQQLLDQANARFSTLPGQAANEAGVALAANNQAVNTGLATTASGAQTMGTGLQWSGMGDDMLKEWKNSLLSQTQLGMQQNRDAAEQRMKQAELDSKSSSGLGAALGAGAGILGTIGNFAVPGGGSLAGSLLGGIAGAATKKGAKGGLIKKMRVGGMVREPDPEDEDEMDDPMVTRGYRPYEDEEGAPEFHNSPLIDVDPRPARDWPHTDSATPRREEEEELDEDGKPMRYDDGGPVNVPLSHYGSPRIPSRSFDPNGIGYDHPTLELEDMQHDTRMGDDGVPHNPSRVPRTGMLLKGRNHPTFDLGVEEDRKLGYGLEMRDGRYYTQPFANPAQRIWGDGGGAGPATRGYAEGGEVMDDEPEFVDTPAEEMMEPGPAEGVEPSNMVPPEASPSGGEETDDVHALLNEGEFVMPKEVTSWYGEKFFQKLIQKAHDEMATMRGAQPEDASPQQAQAVALSAPSFESMGA